MKTLAEGTERIGIESVKIDETLGEKIENVGVKKKKVRVVKKIVKKKIIKKVPKRLLVVPNCNDAELNLSVNNGNDCMEIEKCNDNVVNELEDENVKGVENNQSCRDVSEMSGLVGSSLLGDWNGNELEASDLKRMELQDGDQNRIELKDGEQKGSELQDSDEKGIELRDSDKKQIGLKDSDRNQIELKDGDQDRIELEDTDQNWMELQVYDQNGIELQDMDRKSGEMEDSDGKRTDMQISDDKRIEMQDKDQNRNELRDSDHNQIESQDMDRKCVQMHDNGHILNELQDNDHNRIELQDHNRIELQDSDHYGIGLKDSDEKQIELLDSEHDNNTMDVDEHEGEEGVKEVVVNSETKGLNSHEVSSEKRGLRGETVASWWRMKQRTKIFIHGLNKEIKEDDIRKVFEELGEVVEVKIIRNFRSGNSRGFGFVRYALAEHANLALTKYHNVEVCGSMCHTAAVEGYDTILLNNIDKKWNNENVVALLQQIGIKNIDEVSVVPDRQNTQLNGGFAFLEFETRRDAQMAYHKLQNKKVFGKNSKIEVAWAESLPDPVEEEMHNVKSVYAQHIPPSWGEKEVKDRFKMFGEIESIALAKNLHSTKRNDFAFINYKTCEAALSCIEALTCKKSTNHYGPKAHLKVSLAKSIPKGKSIKTISESAVTMVSKVNLKPNQSRPYQSQYQNGIQSRPSQAMLGVYKPQQPKSMKVSSIGRHDDGGSSTTAELVQLLREQASWKLGRQSSTAGMSTVHQQTASGGKQLPAELGSKLLYNNSRAYNQTLLQIPNATQPRPIVTRHPHYDQRIHYTSESLNLVQANPRYFQTRDQATYPGSSNIYRRMQ